MILMEMIIVNDQGPDLLRQETLDRRRLERWIIKIPSDTQTHPNTPTYTHIHPGTPRHNQTPPRYTQMHPDTAR